MASGSASNEFGSLAEHRSYLLRVAQLQLRDRHRAEDVVQDTLAAAVARPEKFSGRSSLRTWLIGILRHKLLDVFRASARDPVVAEPADQPAADDDARFVEDGRWREPPSDWGDPARSFEKRQFWGVFERCAGHLPERTRQVFAMRELMGLSTQEICAELGITVGNCNVMLYRARMSLRECLEQNWFEGERTS